MEPSAAWPVGSFAGVALLLSIVGLYGVIAYSVGQRAREIGVRMALGARRGSIYSLIPHEAGRLTVTGAVLGLAASVATATVMRSLLFEVQRWDVSILLAAVVLLTVSVLMASFIPAHRAASINPVEAGSVGTGTDGFRSEARPLTAS